VLPLALRYCEERSEEAIQGNKTQCVKFSGLPRALSALAMTGMRVVFYSLIYSKLLRVLPPPVSARSSMFCRSNLAATTLATA